MSLQINDYHCPECNQVYELFCDREEEQTSECCNVIMIKNFPTPTIRMGGMAVNMNDINLASKVPTQKKAGRVIFDGKRKSNGKQSKVH